MLKRKIILFALSVVTALSLYVGFDVTAGTYGVGNVVLANECSTGNGGGGC